MAEFQHVPPMDDNIIDETVLHALRDAIGDDAMTDFLERFFEDCETRTQRIIQAYNTSNFSEVELEAHTLGTSAATYGALKLEKICREVEFAKPTKSQEFQERIDHLHRLSEQSLQVLGDYSF